MKLLLWVLKMVAKLVALLGCLMVDQMVDQWGHRQAELKAKQMADQWAYLITAPVKWRDEITHECLKAASKLEKKITAPPQVVWRKDDPSGFYQLQRFLFLTKDEFTRGVQL